MTTREEPNVVPFGKYKGRLVEELMLDDPAYLQWLGSQDWFRSKFVNLYQLIINRGAAPEDSPEHNALQVLFLNDSFCFAFMRCLYPDFEEAERRELAAQREWDLKESRDKDRVAALLSVDLGNAEFQFKREFEERGIDVLLGVSLHSKPPIVRTYREPIGIEIKPVVGDDYPAVLRQMKTNKSCILLLGDYTGKGASREQLIKTFATAGKRIVFVEEVNHRAAEHEAAG